MKRKFWMRFPLFIAAVIFFVFLAGYIVMSLWNALVPELFNGPVLNYWQAIGLLILSKILFGGIGRRSGPWERYRRHDWRQKLKERMAMMTPEERSRFQAELQKKCGWKFDDDSTEPKTA